MSTLLKPVSWNVQSLVNVVHSGSVQLPDLKRPFVGLKFMIRDLLDSMYRGDPVGEHMLRNVSQEDTSRAISGAMDCKGPHQISAQDITARPPEQRVGDSSWHSTMK